MASNKELTDEALALGKELSVEVVTQGLNNAGLVALVDGLKAQRVAPVTGDQPAPGAAPNPALIPPPDPSPAVAPQSAPALVDGASEPNIGGPPRPGNMPFQRYNHQVAEGKSVVTRRGTIGAFEPVTAEDFGRGVEDLESLVRSGHVTKKA